MKTILCLIPLCAAGCSSTPETTPKPIPSADGMASSDGTVGAVGQQAVKPCGYRFIYDTALNGQPSTHEDLTVSIRYDDGGRDVSETGVDANRKVIMQTDTTFDAMGNWIKRVYKEDGFPDSTHRAVYDSFGRMVRWSAGNNGAEDIIQSYEYDANGDLAKQHIVDPQRTYDVTYKRDTDPQRRVLVTFEDFGADGTIDDHIEYQYDDAGRVTTWQAVSDRDGSIIGGGQRTYDDDNNLLTSEGSDKNDPLYSEADNKFTFEYANGRQVSNEFDEVLVNPDVRYTSSQKVIWKYDGCE